MKILIVEDNRNLARSIERVLKQNSFSVAHFADGLEAEQYILRSHDEIDLIILDIQLPIKDGFNICKTIREKQISTPIIMLTAKQEIEDKVSGLSLGADDYLGKPFQFEELLARVHALLRRPKVLKTETIKLTPNIVFDSGGRRVIRDGVGVSFTPKEFEILEFLIRNKDKAVSQEQIFDHCFDFAKDNWSNTIEVHIKNIRKKLTQKHETPIIKTVRGFGYRLEIQ